jgi:P27 family predicted phage terminase small subunit
MAGRTPKPTALKLVEGNRGKRAINGHEPEPLILHDLSAPAHLPEAHRVIWDELAPKLKRSGVLTEADTILLEMTCAAVATHRLAVSKMDGGKVMMRNEETGAVSLSPWAMLQSMSFKQGLAALREWGATPSSRSRVMVDPQADLFGAGNGNANGTNRFFSQ